MSPRLTARQQGILALMAEGHAMRLSLGYWTIEPPGQPKTFVAPKTVEALHKQGWIVALSRDRNEITDEGRVAIGRPPSSVTQPRRPTVAPVPASAPPKLPTPPTRPANGGPTNGGPIAFFDVPSELRLDPVSSRRMKKELSRYHTGSFNGEPGDAPPALRLACARSDRPIAHSVRVALYGDGRVVPIDTSPVAADNPPSQQTSERTPQH